MQPVTAERLAEESAKVDAVMDAVFGRIAVSSALTRAQAVVAEWVKDGEGWIDTELNELRDLIAVAITDAVAAERATWAEPAASSGCHSQHHQR